MGVNYYLQESFSKCETCQYTPETKKLHIGKVSIGWKFGFHGFNSGPPSEFLCLALFPAPPSSVFERAVLILFCLDAAYNFIRSGLFLTMCKR